MPPTQPASGWVSSQSAVLTVPYTVTDDQGATSTANLVITVTGTNDAPVAQAASVSVAEDAAVLSGSVVATDVDANAALTFALNGPAPAGLTFNTNGTYSFDAANAAYQSLGVGQFTAVLTVPYTVTDDQGATSSANLVITITGTNDAPVANAASVSVAEDAAVVVRLGRRHRRRCQRGARPTRSTGRPPAGLVFNADGTYSFDPPARRTSRSACRPVRRCSPCRTRSPSSQRGRRRPPTSSSPSPAPTTRRSRWPRASPTSPRTPRS